MRSRFWAVLLLTSGGLSAALSQGVVPTVNVQPINPAAFYVRNITLTTSPVQLPSLALLNGVICTPRLSNTGATFVGGADMSTSVNKLPLTNGAPFASGVTQLSALRAYSTVGGDILDCYGN
jgi:hypothetical protein